MGVYTDQMFNLSGTVVTSLTAMNFGTGAVAGAYSPQLNGKLMKITITLVPQAATSLAQYGQFELSQTNWKPNILRFSVGGFGLATAPQALGGNELMTDFVIDQPVQTDWPITGQAVYRGTGPVTPTALILGYFSG